MEIGMTMVVCRSLKPIRAYLRLHQLAAVFFLFTLSQASLALVTERHSIQTYEVEQAPGASLLSSINRVSPIRQNGKVYHGYTVWRIDWHFRWKSLSNGFCALESVNTKLTTTMTLPKLRKTRVAVVNEFNTFLDALTVHEEGHKQISRKGALDIDTAISQLPPQPDCKTLEFKANNVGNAIVERAKTEQIEYDAATEYGCTQGACLKR
jgi:predicted secreted Zn-dependent protease